MNIEKLSKIFRSRILFIVFALFYVGFGVATYKDYGVTWDERDAYTSGEALYQHILGNPNPLYNKDLSKEHSNIIIALYNHIYPASIYGFSDKILNDTSYETFHLLNLLFPLLLYWIFFEVLLRAYKNQWVAISAPIFLFFTPRFLGDAAPNVRDGSFAVIYSLGLSAVYLASKINNSLGKILILGIIFGLAQSFRILGFSLYIITFLYHFYFFYLHEEQKKNIKNLFKFIWHEFLTLGLIGIIATFLMVITSPYLGSNFLYNFVSSAIRSNELITYGTVLYRGEEVSIATLPWHYLPTWIAVTTPIFILLLFIISPLIRNRLKNKLFVLFSLPVIINFAAYLILKPVMFDGFRHFLFLLPIIVFLASITFAEIYKNFNLRSFEIKSKKYLLRAFLLLFIAINLILVGIQYIKLHPYEYIYFNETVGYLKGADGEFTTDYWGASFKEGIEWLKENEITDGDREYKIKTCAHPFQSIYYFEENMKWVLEVSEAEYFVCYSRYNENEVVLEKAGLTDKAEVIHIVERENTPLLYVYKL